MYDPLALDLQRVEQHLLRHRAERVSRRAGATDNGLPGRSAGRPGGPAAAIPRQDARTAACSAA